MKISLSIFALALVAFVACLIWLGSRPDEPIAARISETSRSPSFEVRVVVPRMGRPLGGILPDWVVKKMDGTPSELRFDHTSAGARIGSVADNRVELRADGWDLFIEADGEGRVAPETRLVFPLALGGRHVKLSCRPADPATGYLRTTTRTGSDALAGSFLVELATCKNADSGKTSEWPPSPLTVSGRFAGLPRGTR